ncbi:MAG TPA: hypothetical protein VJS92_13440, partial [Candidatus Polarisedimenticolaceae bacterium]|nr:hypothetical protein [Candidatus Polarisedimenticolaceae bacterium]
GLATAVLEWAAVARAGARETLDIGDCALAAAESRQAAARHALDAERELARLQTRYAEARERREAVEARRPERDQNQATLERARKAELVEPALRLRDDAEREHRTAHDGRDLARGGLPPELRDAGAEQLSALERKLRQDLGGLEAARRAERRSAEITGERADLDRQARADEDLLQDAASWLADWDRVRRTGQERIAAAQEAATRAEHLAGKLDPARRKARAARERDELATRTAQMEERLRTARERANAAHESWLDLKERRLRGIAAELATGLVPGEACAVCGSADHPAPARAGAGHVDRAAEDAAYRDYTRADAAKTDTERELAVVREAFTTASDEARTPAPGSEPAGDAGAALRAGPGLDVAAGQPGETPDGTGPGAEPEAAELFALVEELESEYRHAHHVASGMHDAREALDRAEREHEGRLAARQQAERRVAARTSQREGLDREQAALESELVQARGGAASVAEHAALLERRVGLLAGAAESVRSFDLTAQRLKEADDRLADAAFRAGFDTPRAAAAALLSVAEQRGLQHRIDAWQTEAAAVADRLAEADTRSAAEHP